jgi:hypothetical protein
MGAALAVLALGLFSASALAWFGGEENGQETTTEETTTVETQTGPTGETGPQGTQQTQPAEQGVQQTQPAAEQPVTPTTTPQSGAVPQPATQPAAPGSGIEVKGESGTRGKTKSGGQGGGPVIAQAPATTEVAAASASPSSGELARTGFNVLALILLGGLSLAGSALLFWRARTT